jgi:hypothetical protein
MRCSHNWLGFLSHGTMMTPNITHGSGSAVIPIEPPGRPHARDRKEKAPTVGALGSCRSSVGTKYLMRLRTLPTVNNLLSARQGSFRQRPDVNVLGHHRNRRSSTTDCHRQQGRRGIVPHPRHLPVTILVRCYGQPSSALSGSPRSEPMKHQQHSTNSDNRIA